MSHCQVPMLQHVGPVCSDTKLHKHTARTTAKGDNSHAGRWLRDMLARLGCACPDPRFGCFTNFPNSCQMSFCLPNSTLFQKHQLPARCLPATCQLPAGYPPATIQIPLTSSATTKLQQHRSAIPLNLIPATLPLSRSPTPCSSSSSAAACAAGSGGRARCCSRCPPAAVLAAAAFSLFRLTDHQPVGLPL